MKYLSKQKDVINYTVSETRRFESLSGLFEKKKTNKSKSTHASMWQEIEGQKFITSSMLCVTFFS